MGLEDLALFRALPGSVVFYPTDAVSTERATELAANYHGIVFIRTSRPANGIIYPNEETFDIGKSKVNTFVVILCFNGIFQLIRESPNDKVVVIGAGVTLYEVVYFLNFISYPMKRRNPLPKYEVRNIPLRKTIIEIIKLKKKHF